ncbi:hypothetical protein EW145_g4675 [Phellinidium pouzarii]|uniref:Uncharacterized protein n=1 Tax=Phellinidium pouzarii TaxID=167371 RepID=A0A4S4L2P4_9AGAM|nr:hypothetical protein EW145_g4675 [Phellinidium pouzarii]
MNSSVDSINLGREDLGLTHTHEPMSSYIIEGSGLLNEDLYSQRYSTTSTFSDIASSSDHLSGTGLTLSVTSTMTRSDNVGPGRVLGRVISRGGLMMETSFGQLARSLGFGPYAIAQKLFTRLIQSRVHFLSTTFEDHAVEEEARIACDKLLQFVKDNILSNQQVSLKSIVSLLSAFPILRRFFVSPAATLVFDVAVKFASYRTRNASIFDLCKKVDALLKCMTLFTDQNLITKLVDSHTISSHAGSSSTENALSLLTRLIPFYRHPVLYLLAIQYSKALILQIVLARTSWNVTPKEMIESLYTFDYGKIHASRRSTSADFAASSSKMHAADDTNNKQTSQLWEEICHALVLLEADPRHCPDLPGLDLIFDMILFSITAAKGFDWMTCKFSVEIIFLLHKRDKKTLYPKAHARATTMVKNVSKEIRSLDELTKHILDFCYHHREELLIAFFTRSPFSNKDTASTGFKTAEKMTPSEFIQLNSNKQWQLEQKCTQLEHYIYSEIESVKLQAFDSVAFVITQYPFLRHYFFEDRISKEWSESTLLHGQHLQLNFFRPHSTNDHDAVFSAVIAILKHISSKQQGNTRILYDMLYKGMKFDLRFITIRYLISAIAFEVELATSALPCRPSKANCRCYTAYDSSTDFSWDDVCTIVLTLLRLWEPELQAVSVLWLSAIDKLCTTVLKQLSLTCGYLDTIEKGAILPDNLVELMTTIIHLPVISSESIVFPSSSRSMVEAMEKEITDSEPSFEILKWANF